MTTKTSTSSSKTSCKAFSLLEVLVVVTVVGILGLLAVGQYGRVVDRTRETVALNTVEVLNQGVSKYSQIEGDGLQVVPPDDNSSDEEIDVLRALQWIGESEVVVGGSYVRSDYNPSTSSSTDDYRAVWNGNFYELRIPGDAGAGLLISFDGTDLGSR